LRILDKEKAEILGSLFVSGFGASGTGVIEGSITAALLSTVVISGFGI